MSSKIYAIKKEDLQTLVLQSNSLAEILRKIGLYVSNGNYKPLKKRLKDENIDYSHITLGLDANKNKQFPDKQIPISEILIENSNFSTTQLKKRIIKSNLLEYKCSKCNLGPYWDNGNLVLQLDHINGINNDNRIENLRFLCPNCHSQTITYAARNSRKNIIKKHCVCGKKISKKSTSCMQCATLSIKNHPTKIIWPNKDELIKMVKESNYTQVAKKLGVSDNAIRKRIKK